MIMTVIVTYLTKNLVKNKQNDNNELKKCKFLCFLEHHKYTNIFWLNQIQIKFPVLDLISFDYDEFFAESKFEWKYI